MSSDSFSGNTDPVSHPRNFQPSITTPFSSTLNQSISVKLDAGNYMLWKSLVLPILKGYKLEGYVLGTKACPPEFINSIGSNGDGNNPQLQSNPDYEDWVAVDNLLLGWLLGLVSERLAAQVMDQTTSRGVWKALEELCGARNRAQIANLRFDLQTTKKSNMSMDDYLLTMKKIADNLAVAGCPVPLGDLISFVTLGLDADYTPIVVQIQARDTLSWQELHAILLSYESRMERLNGFSNLSLNQVTANVVSGRQENHNRQTGQNNFRMQNFTQSRGTAGRFARGTPSATQAADFDSETILENSQPGTTPTSYQHIIPENIIGDSFNQILSHLHSNSPTGVHYNNHSSPETTTNNTERPLPLVPCHPMITRSKSGIFKPKLYLSSQLSDVNPDLKEPLTVAEAFNSVKWKQAMDDEFNALQRNNTWTLVPFSPEFSLVGNKWVYKLKFNSDGSVCKHKARLVAKGFHQTPAIDFSETYSPVIKPSTIRVILALAVARSWEIKQLDVNNAFLNGNLEESVYMFQPEGYVDQTKPTHVCKLNKALYGLKQAPRAWFDKLRSELISWGFINSKSDSSLFILKGKAYLIYILIYVDDILITGNSLEEMQRCIQQLNQKFSLKDLGELHYFLGIEVRRDFSGIFLSQNRYVTDLLKRLNFEHLKSCPTPVTISKSQTNSEAENFHDPTLYRSVVGALQYATYTRPDIAYSVNKLSQHLQNPKTDHWLGVKRVLRYLKGTTQFGIHIKPGEELSIIGFSDADWACNNTDRKSIGGYCVFLGDSLVSWQSKKQSVVSRSSTESEYRALANTAAEISWLQSLLSELEYKLPSCPIIWCDNTSASALASNPVYHARTKHIEIDLHFIRDKVLQKLLEVRYVPSCDQTADCFTKALPHTQFHYLRSKLGVIEIPSSLRGDVKAAHHVHVTSPDGPFILSPA